MFAKDIQRSEGCQLNRPAPNSVPTQAGHAGTVQNNLALGFATNPKEGGIWVQTLFCHVLAIYDTELL